MKNKLDSYIVASGKLVQVDSEDFRFLNNFTWHLDSSGQVVTSLNRGNGKKNLVIEMFLFLKPTIAGKIIWHKNKNTLDNRKENLVYVRKAIVSQHNEVKPRLYSKYKGVSKHNSGKGKWFARIRTDQKAHYLGVFDTEVEAALAYNEAAIKFFGEYAYQNEIDPNQLKGTE